MKNLANCKPTEFLKQTNRIRKAVEKWLTMTDIMNIRKNMPDFEDIDEGLSVEETEKAIKRNQKKKYEQAKTNLSRILDAVLEEHPDETLELMALMCFVEPKDVDKHTMDEYFTELTEMITNQAVIGFFTSLVRLGQMNISDV